VSKRFWGAGELAKVAMRAVSGYACIAAIRGLNVDNVHDTGEIVGEYVQRHFGSYLRKAFIKK
jgi:hypothetical protein